MVALIIIEKQFVKFDFFKLRKDHLSLIMTEMFHEPGNPENDPALGVINIWSRNTQNEKDKGEIKNVTTNL